jgi:hypothetical protein
MENGALRSFVPEEAYGPLHQRLPMVRSIAFHFLTMLILPLLNSQKIDATDVLAYLHWQKKLFVIASTT